MNRSFAAAKSFDVAAGIAIQQKLQTEAAELLEKASNYYRQDGASDKAAETLIRGAKLLEESNPEKAGELYMDSLKIYQDDDKEIFSKQAFTNATNFFVKNSKFDDAINVLNQKISVSQKLKQDVNQIALSLIIIHLFRGDRVAAEKIYQDYNDASAEMNAGGELLDAFEKGSNEDLQKIASKQIFHFLDNEILRLLKKLKITTDSIEMGLA